jgi:predicted PolB exonuclease-like 3'-5' exonuclease
MKPTVIVWDLETVPDLGGFAAANDLVGKSDVEVREAIGDKFPKHIYHSIICIGALIAHREPDHWAVDAIGAPHVGERTEKQLIASFCDKVAELSPQLVTFNGNSFDLPVLRYRAMVHGVSAPGLYARSYFHRYAEDAVDLCDVFSSFSPQGKATLHEISRVMGLPAKPKGFALTVQDNATSGVALVVCSSVDPGGRSAGSAPAGGTTCAGVFSTDYNDAGRQVRRTAASTARLMCGVSVRSPEVALTVVSVVLSKPPL